MTNGTTTQNSINTDAVDNVNYDTENLITDDNKLKNENKNALKIGADAQNDTLKDSGITTVTNWGELKSAISNGAVIELDGDDVYYAEGFGITINSGTVSIDGKGHTIDAQGLNCRIFEINNDANLILKNLILKNAKNDQDGGAIYNNQGTLTVTAVHSPTTLRHLIEVGQSIIMKVH